MLSKLQHWLRDAIKEPTTNRDQRVDIYAAAYLTRLADALATNFPAVCSVLENTLFARLASEYLKAHPSQSANIAGVGRHLPFFIETSKFAPSLPFLPDLAELEWLLIEAFHAPEGPLFPDAVVHPAVRLLKSDWPVDRIWNTKRKPERAYHIDPAPIRLLIFRDGFRPQVVRIDALQWELLSLLQSSLPLERALEHIERLDTDGATLPDRIQKWFSTWATQGVLVL